MRCERQHAWLAGPAPPVSPDLAALQIIFTRDCICHPKPVKLQRPKDLSTLVWKLFHMLRVLLGTLLQILSNDVKFSSP